MIPRRVMQDTAPELPASVVRTVLEGWSAGGPALHDPELFTLFQERTAGIIRVWREHEVFLRREAVRLGIQPAYGTTRHPQFFGESLARQQIDRKKNPEE